MDAAQVLQHDVERHRLLIIVPPLERNVEPNLFARFQRDSLRGHVDLQYIGWVRHGHGLHSDVKASPATSWQVNLFVRRGGPHQEFAPAAWLGEDRGADDSHICCCTRGIRRRTQHEQSLGHRRRDGQWVNRDSFG